jgi:hypothetical protein
MTILKRLGSNDTSYRDKDTVEQRNFDHKRTNYLLKEDIKKEPLKEDFPNTGKPFYDYKKLGEKLGLSNNMSKPNNVSIH